MPICLAATGLRILHLVNTFPSWYVSHSALILILATVWLGMPLFHLHWYILFSFQNKLGQVRARCNEDANHREWGCLASCICELWMSLGCREQALRDQTQRAGEEAVINHSLEHVISPLQGRKNDSMMSMYSRTRNSFIVTLGKLLLVPVKWG